MSKKKKSLIQLYQENCILFSHNSNNVSESSKVDINQIINQRVLHCYQYSTMTKYHVFKFQKLNSWLKNFKTNSLPALYHYHCKLSLYHCYDCPGYLEAWPIGGVNGVLNDGHDFVVNNAHLHVHPAYTMWGHVVAAVNGVPCG